MTLRNSFFSVLLLLLFMNYAKAEPYLHDLHGKKIPLSSLAGKWVIINYWASWCQPCLNEIPELNRFYERYKSNNLAMFGVNYDMLPTRQQKMLVQELGIRYPILKNDPSSLFHLGDIRGVPVTFVFNPHGHLSDTLYGEQTAESLMRATRAN